MILDLTTVEGTRRTMDKAYLQVQREYAEYLFFEEDIVIAITDDPTHDTAATLDGMLDYVELTIAGIREDGVQDADDAAALAIYYLARTRIIELQEA